MYRFTDTTASAIRSPVAPVDNMSINGQPLNLLVEGYRHLTVTGRGLIGQNIKTTSVPGRRGVWVDDYSDKERVLEIKYKLEAETSSDLRNRFAKLNRLLRRNTTSGFLEITFADEPEYTYYGYLQDADDIEETSLSMISKFTLLIPDGYKKKRPQSSTGVVSLVDAEEVLPDEIVVTVNHDGRLVRSGGYETVEKKVPYDTPRPTIIAKSKPMFVAKDNSQKTREELEKNSKLLKLKPNTTYTISAMGRSNPDSKFEIGAVYIMASGGPYDLMPLERSRTSKFSVYSFTTPEDLDDSWEMEIVVMISYSPKDDLTGFALDWYVLSEGTEAYIDYPEDEKEAESKPVEKIDKIISKDRHKLLAKDNTKATQDQFKKFSKQITLKPNTTYTVSARGKSDYYEKNGHYGFLDFGNDIRENSIVFKNINYEVKTLTFRTDDVVDFRVLARMAFSQGQEDWKGFALDWYVLVEGTKTYQTYPSEEKVEAVKKAIERQKPKERIAYEVINTYQEKMENVVQIQNRNNILSFRGDYSRDKQIVIKWSEDEITATYDRRNILHELERFSPLEVFTLRNGDVVTARNADVKKVTWRDERL